MISTKSRPCPNVVLLMTQRLRRWPIISAISGEILFGDTGKSNTVQFKDRCYTVLKCPLALTTHAVLYKYNHLYNYIYIYLIKTEEE